MIHPISRFILVVAAVAISARRQNLNPNTIVGAGYLAPLPPISLAPGQVITVFAIGVGNTLMQPVFAGTGKLPTSLAGISVTIAQETNLPAPILVVSPGPRCPNCPVLTAITIQVPYELYQPPAGGGVSGGIVQSVDLFVTENGVAGNWTIVLPWPDQIHILTTCDTVFGGSGTSSGRCPWELTHADGTLVSNVNPAAAGEQLVAYAVGLGATNPGVATGEPATQPTPTAATFRLGFNFQADAPPSMPQFSQANPALTPLFTGLTPGYPGLYQINFVVPAVPEGLLPCPKPGQALGPGLVNTNLTVSVGGSSSFDGAEICVLLPE
jgi:uncharacterized protein (TIGR03437 family)